MTEQRADFLITVGAIALLVAVSVIGVYLGAL
jgi:hypothetical protein